MSNTYAEAEATYGHPLQYALVDGLQRGGVYVGGTEQLDDDAVLAKLRTDPGDLTDGARWMLDHPAAYRVQLRVERYNRCPTCEQWSPCDKRKEPAHPGG